MIIIQIGQKNFNNMIVDNRNTFINENLVDYKYHINNRKIYIIFFICFNSKSK